MAVLPSIYQAKLTKVAASTAEALIPQIFGEAPVIISRFVGDVPTALAMGWVLFQGGNPEFPVWLSMATGASVEGGPDEVWVGPDPPHGAEELWLDSDTNTLYGLVNGAWVQVSGTDEVWIGNYDPIVDHPTIELWYDPDGGSADDQPVARMQLWYFAGTGVAPLADDSVSTESADTMSVMALDAPLVPAQESTTVPPGTIGIPGAPSQALEVVISRLDSTLQVDWTYRISSLKVGDRLYLQYAPDANSWHLYDVTGTPTQIDVDTWSIPVTTVAGSPPGTAPPVGAQVYIQWPATSGAISTGNYTHNQSTASATWVIAHGLGFYPNVHVEDSSGADVEGDVHYDNLNQITITFSAAFAGVAYLS